MIFGQDFSGQTNTYDPALPVAGQVFGGTGQPTGYVAGLGLGLESMAIFNKTTNTPVPSNTGAGSKTVTNLMFALGIIGFLWTIKGR